MAKSKKKKKNKKSQKPKAAAAYKPEKNSEIPKKVNTQSPKMELAFKDEDKEVKNAPEMQKAKTEITVKPQIINEQKATKKPGTKSEITEQKAKEEPVKNIKKPAQKADEASDKKIKSTKQKVQVAAGVLITDGDYTEVLGKDDDSVENNEKGIFSKFFRQVQ